MKLHKHTQKECKVVLESVKDLIRQINNIEDKELRKHICASATEMCDRLIKDGKEV